MERKGVTIKEAQLILGNNFIGADQLKLIHEKIGVIDPMTLRSIPEIPYDEASLQLKASTHILILGVPFTLKNEPLSLAYLRDMHGINPDLQEPCFYNQDWYIKESFFLNCDLEAQWYLVRKEVKESTRGLSVKEIQAHGEIKLPSALLCSFVFFAYYFHTGAMLWKDDFVWSRDVDHNGDQIYIGRYCDPLGINKNGFSIHRHLSLRKCYGAIDFC